MEDKEAAVLDTKLEILIGDFQDFRREQRKVNKELTTHGSSETEVQAKILTTLKWHTVIGSFMMGIIMYLLYNQVGGST